MNILIAASEVAPIIKLGGLGDVIGSLPKALEKIGVDADVIVPYFPAAKIEKIKLYKSRDIEVPYDNEVHRVEVFKTKLPDSLVDVFLLKNKFFQSGGKNAFANNITETELFTFFDRAVVEFIKSGFNTYDLVHCNDWHTGLITHLLADEIGTTRPATLLTVHNLSYQGKGDEQIVQSVGIIPGDHPLIDWDIQDGDISLLLQGITSSDFVSTVSPSYAKEILYKDLGGELSDILFDRQSKLIGILNGIDYEAFPRTYTVKDWDRKKPLLKKKLQKKLNLEEKADAPLFAFISRLDPNQKGLDILFEAVPEIVKEGGQFVLLGTGDPVWEEKFKKLEDDKNLKGNIAIKIEFDVNLALDIYSGIDFKIVPSRFEPCGLTQMIAMWYGALPVAHATGGLRDSIKDGKNGFLFSVYSSKDLIKALKRAMDTFSKKSEYKEMVETAMETDFSWDSSAKKYKELYEKIIQIREHQVELYMEKEEVEE